MDGIARIDKVVAEFKVWPDNSLFPVPYMKVKIVQREDEFTAFPNLHRRHSQTRYPEYLAGTGNTAEEALSDLLVGFVAEVREHCPAERYVEADFEWSTHEDF